MRFGYIIGQDVLPGDDPAAVVREARLRRGWPPRQRLATVTVKKRLAARGSEHRAALREVGRYQAAVKRYWDALAETRAMHERKS